MVQEKPYEATLLTREQNGRMKKKRGPKALGPLIKMSKWVAREGAKKRRG